jgi:hypothetical protein
LELENTRFMSVQLHLGRQTMTLLYRGLNRFSTGTPRQKLGKGETGVSSYLTATAVT